jgi:hypothetical protein
MNVCFLTGQFPDVVNLGAHNREAITPSEKLPSMVIGCDDFIVARVSRGARGSCRTVVAGAAFDLQPHLEPTHDRDYHSW